MASVGANCPPSSLISLSEFGHTARDSLAFWDFRVYHQLTGKSGRKDRHPRPGLGLLATAASAPAIWRHIPNQSPDADLGPPGGQGDFAAKSTQRPARLSPQSGSGPAHENLSSHENRVLRGD